MVATNKNAATTTSKDASDAAAAITQEKIPLILVCPLHICPSVCVNNYSPLLRDGKLIFGGEQRRDQDICL